MATKEAAGASAGSRVAIGLGSNLGDRLAHLRFGIVRLRRILTDLRCSAVHETDPVGVKEQPAFLNACCVGRTRLSPVQLVSELLDAERRAGRRRNGPRFGPRILDLDLLLYADLVLESEHVTVPHPRIRERAFVLVPLAEIAGEWVIPASGVDEAVVVAELADRIDPTGIRRTDLDL